MVTSDRKIECDMDREVGVASAVMWAEGKSQKAKLLISQSVF